jgi:hypothetical protein
VFEAFKPLARREWLAWGGELLFGDLREEVAKEEAEEEARRAREVEDGIQEAAAAAKAARIEDRRAALVVTRNSALAEFRAKSLSKEELKKRNAELEAEARDIERDEAGEEVEDDEEEPELPTVRLGKRKAVVLDVDEEEEEEDELEADETKAKRAKMSGSDLLDVEGPVSGRGSLNSFGFANNFVRSAIDALGSSPSRRVSSRRGLPSAPDAPEQCRVAIGEGFRGKESERRT